MEEEGPRAGADGFAAGRARGDGGALGNRAPGGDARLGGSGGNGFGDGIGGALYADSTSAPIVRTSVFTNNVALVAQGGLSGERGRVDHPGVPEERWQNLGTSSSFI